MSDGHALQLKSWVAFGGAITGLAVIAGTYFGVRAAEVDWVLLIALTVLQIVLYIVAAVAQKSFTQAGTFAELMRGLLVGINAGGNFAIWFWIFDAALGDPIPGLVLGGVTAVFNTLTVFRPLSQNQFFQGILGYMNWIMPMSWVIVGLGFGFTFFSLLLALFTGFQVRYLRPQGVKVDWKTGTFFMRGGLVSNLNPIDTAFNMGNFSFVDKDSTTPEGSDAWHVEHEAGHTLNLASFGWAFHLLGALDEMVVPGRGMNAYAERLADSNDAASRSRAVHIPMWSSY